MCNPMFKRFANQESYDRQYITQLNNGMFMWSLNDIHTFEMFFHQNGTFSHSVQESIDGGLDTFTKPNGKIPEPLSKQLMLEILKSPNKTLHL